MSSLDLTNRSLATVILEASVCLVMNIISFTGNVLVCLAVYKNPRLRSTINLYIIALAVGDLVCATVEMPLAAAVLIAGKWDFGAALCTLQGFVDVFATYTTPATMGLTAFNRYMRIVKTNHYNKIFSPRKSKIWLSVLWCSLAFYLVVSQLTNWASFQFIPGYAVCSISFTISTNRIIHYCAVFGLYFVLPFCVGFFSYCKVFLQIRQHKLAVTPSLINSSNSAGRMSVREIKVSCLLFYVVAGFLVCWVPMWGLVIWKRFYPDTAPRFAQLLVSLLLFLSSSINPFIYAATNRVFREEFLKLLRFWKLRKMGTKLSLENNGPGAVE